METNSIHFNAAIAAAELHGEWQTALQLLRRMLAEKGRQLHRKGPAPLAKPRSFQHISLYQIALAILQSSRD